jgi:hypothetical protein
MRRVTARAIIARPIDGERDKKSKSKARFR